MNERKIGELSAENNRLSLSNSSLYYNFRQIQEALAEERKKGKSANSSRDAQITSEHIHKKALQRKIGELQIELYRASEAGSRESSMYRQSLAAKDEQMAGAQAKIAKLESSNTDCIAKGTDCFAVSYKKKNGFTSRSMEELGQGNHTEASQFTS